jgi:hypothetical protein
MVRGVLGRGSGFCWIPGKAKKRRPVEEEGRGGRVQRDFACREWLSRHTTAYNKNFELILPIYALTYALIYA